MIPVRLRVQNFMCYRNPPPLLFQGIHTACISGDNGNGKSALIDAMTWALWGQTRAKSDDDLVFQGQTEMEVEFDFALGEQQYKVIRKRSQPKRAGAQGRSLLELQVAIEDGFRPISGSTISETQKKIIDLLHMDYEVFTSSAYLRQGNADQFTRQQPAKRKEVLASILDLSRYDQLEEVARERARQQETQKLQLDTAIKELDIELARKPECETRLAQASQESEQADALVKQEETNLNNLRQKNQLLEGKKTQLTQIDENASGIKKDIDNWDSQAKQHSARVKGYEELLSKRPEIEQGYARLAEAKKLFDELDHKLRQSASLNNRMHQLAMAVQQAQAALLTEHKLCLSKLEENEAKSQKLPKLKDELHLVDIQLQQLSGQEDALQKKRQDFQAVRSKADQLEAAIARLGQEITEIDKKLGMLFSQHEAKCPLCETSLGQEGLKLIQDKYTVEKEQKSAELKSNQAELAKKRLEVKALEAEIYRNEQQLNKDKANLQGKTGVLKRQIAEAEESATLLSAETERRSEVEKKLAGKEYAIAEQEASAKLAAEIAALGYDPEKHDEARHRKDELARYEDSKRKLDEADRLIQQEKEAAGKAEESGKDLRNRLEAQAKKRQELVIELGELPRLTNELNRAQVAYQEITKRQKEAQESLGSVRAVLDRLIEQEVKKKEKAALLAQAAREMSVYSDLAKAFGKKGIQAMLIETALPEIEVDADRLLARMTDNRMHVKFETQRETKKGDTVETLDITISDELGTRNYEMFSGGEAFRINFAIRIALSKLLARRAGAPLRTLIIDEGFGTQDSTGIEKVKEAINSIQDDFDKTLVITHIDELRDAFPTRIDVVKTAEGSTVEVN